MRTAKLLLTFTIMLLIFASSCKKSMLIELDQSISKQKVTVNVHSAQTPTDSDNPTDSDTKISLDTDNEDDTWVTAWEEGDLLGGWSGATSGIAVDKFEMVELDEYNTKSATFSGSAVTSSDLYLVYPYEEGVTVTDGKYPIDISSQEINTTDKHNSYADNEMYMVSDPIAVTSDGEVTAAPTMQHTMASMEIEFYYKEIEIVWPTLTSKTSTDDGTTTTVDVTYTDNEVTLDDEQKIEIPSTEDYADMKIYRIEISGNDICTSGSIDLATGEAIGSSVGTIVINLQNVVDLATDGSSVKIPFSMIPYSPENGITVKMYLTDGVNSKKIATFTKSYIPEGLTFEAGKHSTIQFDLKGGSLEEYWDFAGSGTEGDPYRISTVNDMWIISNNVNAGTGDGYYGKFFRVTNNIDMGIEYEEIDLNSSAGMWTPIGVNLEDGRRQGFRGTFDGGGFTIYGIYVDNTYGHSYDAVGLFGTIGIGGVVKNLGVQMVSSHESPEFGTGAVAGRSYGTIVDCVTSIQPIEKKYDATIAFRNYPLVADCVGGVVGRNEYGIVADCVSRNYRRVKGSCVGGIAGWSSGQVVNCYNYDNNDNLWGLEYVGGIVGYVDGSASPPIYIDGLGTTVTSSSVENCFNKAGIDFVLEGERDDYTIGENIGNIVGWASQYSTISNCVNLERYDTGKSYVKHILGGTDLSGSIGSGGISQMTETCHFIYPSNFYTVIGVGNIRYQYDIHYEFVEYLNEKARELNAANVGTGKYNACAWGPTRSVTKGITTTTISGRVAMDSDFNISLWFGDEPLPRGTQSNPYYLSSHFDLKLLAQNVNNGTSYKDTYFELTNKIEYDWWFVGEMLDKDGDDGVVGGGGSPLNTDPKYLKDTTILIIGNEANRFEGKIEGNGYTIRDVYIDGTATDNEVGLFGVLGENAEIENLGIVGGDLTTSVENCVIAPLAGRNYGRINNCYTTTNLRGDESEQFRYLYVRAYDDAVIGGIVGENMAGASLSNVYTVTIMNYNTDTGTINTIGGIVGNNFENASLSYAYYYGPYNGNGIGNMADLSTMKAIPSQSDMFQNYDFVDLLNSSQPSTRWYYKRYETPTLIN